MILLSAFLSSLYGIPERSRKMHRFHFWRTRETDRGRRGGRTSTRKGMETKFREDEAGSRMRRGEREGRGKPYRIPI